MPFSHLAVAACTPLRSSGAFATTYVATWLPKQRSVAVKVALNIDDRSIERWRLEVPSRSPRLPLA